jgi:hypothetical protein
MFIVTTTSTAGIMHKSSQQAPLADIIHKSYRQRPPAGIIYFKNNVMQITFFSNKKKFGHAKIFF